MVTPQIKELFETRGAARAQKHSALEHSALADGRPGSVPAWLESLNVVVRQSPLLVTWPSSEALLSLERWRRPNAVYVGVGLCTQDQLTESTPVDLLGLILPAERVRRAVGASSLVVTIADSHAYTNDFSVSAVRRSADRTAIVLRRMRRELGLRHMQIYLASQFHRTQGYREVYRWVERAAGSREHLYFKQEVADVEYLDRVLGGILKVGWTLNRGPDAADSIRDELAFDRRFQSWMGHHVGFVYCKPGRTLDDRRPKASPYTVVDSDYRICLEPGEDVSGKLRRAERDADPSTVKGLRNHLKAVTRIYREVVAPISGPVEECVQDLVETLSAQPGEEPTSPEPDIFQEPRALR